MRPRTFGALVMSAMSALLGAASLAQAQAQPQLFGGLQQPKEKAPLFPQRRGPVTTFQAQAPIVNCGMVVIPATPEVDPKSIKKAPDDKKYTMRQLAPQLCASGAPVPIAPKSKTP
jgi:hypothetical protein